jgi:tetratricopeptide (TPR) repeat protein
MAMNLDASRVRPPLLESTPVSTHSRRPLLDSLYEKYLEAENSAAFIRQVGQRYSVATLERLCESGDRMSRRGAALALGFLADFESNGILGKALRDRDRGVRSLAENAIRLVWCRIGTPSQRQELGAIIRLNNAQNFSDAIARASSLIDIAPWIAESWNQRAIAYFSTSKFLDAIRDCQQTLEINPYHFGAAAGMGYCYVQLREHASAAECFRRALKLNPGMESARAKLVEVQRVMKDGE